MKGSSALHKNPKQMLLGHNIVRESAV